MGEPGRGPRIRRCGRRQSAWCGAMPDAAPETSQRDGGISWRQRVQKISSADPTWTRPWYWVSDITKGRRQWRSHLASTGRPQGLLACMAPWHECASCWDAFNAPAPRWPCPSVLPGSGSTPPAPVNTKLELSHLAVGITLLLGSIQGWPPPWWSTPASASPRSRSGRSLNEHDVGCAPHPRARICGAGTALAIAAGASEACKAPHFLVLRAPA